MNRSLRHCRAKRAPGIQYCTHQSNRPATKEVYQWVKSFLFMQLQSASVSKSFIRIHEKVSFQFLSKLQESSTQLMMRVWLFYLIFSLYSHKANIKGFTYILNRKISYIRVENKLFIPVIHNVIYTHLFIRNISIQLIFDMHSLCHIITS